MKKSVPKLRCFYPKLLFKCLLMMKLTILLVLATFVARATVHSQSISITVQQTEVKRVLTAIEKRTKVRFLYNYELEGLRKKVDFSVQDMDVLAALEKLLPGAGLKYKTLNNNMIAILAEGDDTNPLDVIKGRITDQSNAPIPNANVQVQGTNAGTMSDNNGDFSLTAASNAVLVITAVGYGDTTIALAGRTTLTIQLKLATKDLDQVVVVGYGTARKKDLTGAVANVTAKDFNVGAITDPMEQIQGKVAGIQIIQSSGDPNQSLNIKLRGQASISGSQTPLIVLDGVPLSDPTQISNLLPADIASYDVLKDASAAAIYGSQGANGVIIINTKKGQAGQVKVEYNGFVTMSEVAKYYPLLNFQQWKTGSINYLVSQGSTQGAADTTVAQFGNGNTDWQKAITRKTISQNQSLAVSGGTGHFNYRGSLDYLDQEGVVLNSYKKGLGLNLALEQKAVDNRLDIQFGLTNTSYTRNETDPTQLDYPLYNPPAYPVRNADGSYYTFYDYGEANPVEHLNEMLNQWKETFTVEKAQIDFALLPSLKIGTLGSLSHFNQQKYYFEPAYPTEDNLNTGNSNLYNNDQDYINAHIQFNKDFGKHNLGVSAVYEYTYFTDNSFYAQGSEYPVEANQAYNLGSGNQTYDVISSYKEESMLESYVARATYNYNSEFYATATFRRDGSSKFGSNNRFGNFPSFDLAWALTQEKFMQNVHWVDFLKLRAGYGVTGNQGAISDYNTLFLLGQGGRYFDASSTTFPYPYSYSPSQNANPDLKWETRHGRNVGVSFALLNSRLSGDIDYYNDKTTNLLDEYTVPTPPFYLSTILANVGSLTNKGLDVSLTYDVIKGRHFSWSAGGQITFMKTRILNLNGEYDGYKLAQDSIGEGVAEGRGLTSTPITWFKAGYSPFVFYLPHFVGLDQNGNQLFDSAGKAVPVGNAINRWIDPAPKFNYGFNSTFTYDNWSLNFFLRGVAGQKIFNNIALNESFIKRLPGDNIFKGGLTNGITDASTVSDLWLEKAGFLRLDNATLAYNFKGIKGIDNLRVYATGNNLFVITKYSGLDPEVRTTPTVQAGNSLNEAYIDAGNGSDGNYYRVRAYTIGVSLGFK